MAFCTKCGKQLKDGEVCSCQGGKASNLDVTAAANGIMGAVKEIIADPQEGAKKFVAGISWVGMAVLAVIYALITVLTNVFYKVKANINHVSDLKDWADDMDMDYEDYVDEFDVDTLVYEVGDIIKGIFTDILQVAAGIAIMAVVTYFAVKLIKKIEITWKMAVAIAVIELVIIVPLTVVYRVLDFIPDFKLLSWILGAISSVRSWGAIILTYLGIKSVCGDSKSAIYVGLPTIAVVSIVSSLVSFLITSIL